jgi:arginyl-tRNA synthetase
MDIQESILNTITQAFEQLFDHQVSTEDLSLQATRKEFEGSYTFVLFPYLKITKSSPEQAGGRIGDYLKENHPDVADFNVVKGFLNISLSSTFWIDLLNQMMQEKEPGHFPPRYQKVMVEYSSPNTNKPLHLGHLRNNFLGYSVASILRAYGYEVIKTNLVNDRGIHICKSMVAYQKLGQDETPETSGMKGDHLVGKYYVLFDQEYKRQIKKLISAGSTEEAAKKEAPWMKEAQEMLVRWEAGDEDTVKLWKKLNNWVYRGFNESYRKMGVTFDQYYYESDTYLLGKDIVSEGLNKGVFFKKENGSVWADLSPYGLDEKLVLRADGTSVYMTQDMGTADLKFKDYAIDKSVYVVGNEQDYHFEVLFKIMQLLERPYGNNLHHLSYGMVDLPSGKMKSREGTVVDADDLIKEMVDTARSHTQELGKIEGFSQEEAEKLYEMLGLGALKYFLLKVDPKKRMLFNPQESIEFQGNTGPFIQYTHARIAAILRKADQIDLDYSGNNFDNLDELENVEKQVIFILSDYSKKIALAAEELSPAVIAQYLFELAKEYNRFYAELPIFSEAKNEVQSLRVALSSLVSKTISSGMKLLGIDVPQKM